MWYHDLVKSMIISGDRVQLRNEPRQSDYENMLRWWELDEWQYYDEPDAIVDRSKLPSYETWYKKMMNRDGRSWRWQIDTEDGQHIGWVIYYEYDQDDKTAFVGIDIPEPENWGKGLGTEALSLLIDHLFEYLDLIEIRTATWTGNGRMIRCAEKCGFQRYLVMPHRSPLSVRGEPLERIVFFQSKDEWRENKRS